MRTSKSSTILAHQTMLQAAWGGRLPGRVTSMISHLAGRTSSSPRHFTQPAEAAIPHPLPGQAPSDALANANILPPETCARIVELVRLFKSRGHLAAQLDPLRRAARGPWLQEGRQISCSIPPSNSATTGSSFTAHQHHEHHQQFPDSLASRSDDLLSQLLDSYPWRGSQRAKADHVSTFLRLPDASITVPKALIEQPLLAGLPNHHQTPHQQNPSPQQQPRQHYTLPDLVEHLAQLYCSTLAVEAAHLTRQQEAAWLHHQFESRQQLPGQQQVAILEQLARADGLEHFLAQAFPASKRFGLEGCEALVPGLRALVERSARHGVRRVELGMAHRGRLNVLVNLLGKRVGALCAEMKGEQSGFHVGDVKYHLGQSGTLECVGGVPVRLSIAPNPSHLEAVDPVVLGMVRAEQTRLGSAGRRRVLGMLLHGDAAVAGQGIVAECLQLSNVPGFSTGGTIHIVINNQVGFTTAPLSGRSSVHATDVFKLAGAPILHANADDPEAVVQACLLAADWRARYGRDVVVDIVGYRRNGHNELDDPSETLPLTYRQISRHPTVLQIYAQQLQARGLVTEQQTSSLVDSWRKECESELAAARAGQFRESAQQFLVSSWQGDALQAVAEASGPVATFQEPTGLPLDTLQRVGRALSQPPPAFRLHPDMAKLTAARGAMVQDADSRVDWAMAEALAMGTLMLHRATLDDSSSSSSSSSSVPLGLGLNWGHYDVRLTGQDVERGTFNQRHAVLYDQDTGARCVALNSVRPGAQDALEVWNSPLSEAAVLGFEYGYSLGARDRALVLWDAQFGDFLNNAQVMVDQFIASGEEKWGQQSGLVLLLPHGYDGQGPDHSSARLERLLSLCNDDADHLPGHGPAEVRLMRQTYEELSRDLGGRLDRQRALELLKSLGIGSGGGGGGVEAAELAELLWCEMGLPDGGLLTEAAWSSFMTQYLRRHAERHANLFVVCCSTPAQYFHALRRQANLPYKKPLALLAPKYLLHHKPATSALRDLATGTFFTRVIDDGKRADNTRHLAAHPRTGEPYLLPPSAIRRVVVCSGQLYYHLSRARRQRRIRDVVLVRLEQISPFPHDRLMAVVRQYAHAELVWAQEEPKNMGAWGYVKPRLETALRELGPASSSGSSKEVEQQRVRYVGRPAAASPATASFAIHQRETQELIEAALC